MSAMQCESCAYYEYDDEYDEYCCSVNIDEDELYRIYQDTSSACPYYRNGDEYAVVRKQN